jgi:hypothetical protein
MPNYFRPLFADLQLAFFGRQLRVVGQFESVLKGHDFSRAAKAAK